MGDMFRQLPVGNGIRIFVTLELKFDNWLSIECVLVRPSDRKTSVSAPSGFLFLFKADCTFVEPGKFTQLYVSRVNKRNRNCAENKRSLEFCTSCVIVFYRQ